jgi:hypothetical protein
MSTPSETADLLPGAPLSRAAGLTRLLVWFYGACAALGAALLVLALAPVPSFARLDGLAAEFLAGGLGETALCAVLLGLTASIAASLLTSSRLELRRAEASLAAGPDASRRRARFVWLRKLGDRASLGPGVMARHGQAIVITVGGLVMGLLAWWIWPPVQGGPAASSNTSLLAAVVIVLAFPSLILERTTSGFPADQMPEAPGLRRLLLLVTLALAASGAAEIGRGFGMAWVGWVQRGLSIVVLVAAGELTLRALGRLFLPTPTVEAAKAATDSIVAALLTGGPRAPAALIRAHLGLDFARSWALSYLTKAAMPAAIVTALFCWGLTGVKLLNADQRGVYERLGARDGPLLLGLDRGEALERRPARRLRAPGRARRGPWPRAPCPASLAFGPHAAGGIRRRSRHRRGRRAGTASLREGRNDAAGRR